MIRGIKKTLGGAEYVIPPLTLGALEDMQERLAAFKGDMSPESVATVIDAAHAALRRNYPDMTRNDVRDIIDVADMLDVMEAVMDVAGMRRKEIEAGASQGEVVAPAA